MRAVVLLSVLTILLVVGCESSSGDSGQVFVPTSATGGVATPEETAVGTILLRTQLQTVSLVAQQTSLIESAIVPTEVTRFRVSGLNRLDQLEFGPKSYAKAAEVTIEGVPLTVARVRIELLNAQGLVVGDVSLPVTLGEGETVVLNRPTFTLTVTSPGPNPDPIPDPEPPNYEQGRISISSNSAQGTEDSKVLRFSISNDGRYVAFASLSALDPADTNFTYDVYVRDRQTGTTRLVSVDSSGNVGNSSSESACISANGRFVAFVSQSTNFDPRDTDIYRDIYVHDLQTGATELASVNSFGTKGNQSSVSPCLSGDGRFLVFSTFASNLDGTDVLLDGDIYIRDLLNGTTELLSLDTSGAKGNGASDYPSITSDGRFVTFTSNSTNLDPNDTDNQSDIYLRDRLAGTTELVSVDSSGVKASSSLISAIAADGRFVVFVSDSQLEPTNPNISSDVFVRDLQESTTELVSRSPLGEFGDSTSEKPSISADGRFVVFSSNAGNFGTQDTSTDLSNIFVRDIASETTTLVSVGFGGEDANDSSLFTSISGDGGSIVFDSYASNLVENDTNDMADVFVFANPSGI